MPTTPYMKKMMAMKAATQGRAWKDFTKVKSRVRIPSPFDSSFTTRRTRKRRKKETEIMFPGWRNIENIIKRQPAHQQLTHAYIHERPNHNEEIKGIPGITEIILDKTSLSAMHNFLTLTPKAPIFRRNSRVKNVVKNMLRRSKTLVSN